MAAGSSKRSYDEFKYVSEVDHEAKHAKVHGIVASLSPMKESTSGCSNFFDGQLTDGKTNLRLVGFDTSHQQRLAEFYEKHEPVALVNCKVKSSKWGSELEIMMGKHTQMLKSPSKFDVSTMHQPITEVTLDQLERLQVYQRISVRIKVDSERDVLELKNGLKKQDLIMGDATGTAKLTVWEKNVTSLKKGGSYKLSGLMVKVYNGLRYLSIPKEDVHIINILDIGSVEENEPKNTDVSLEDAVVMGVMHLETFRSCFMCKGKVQTTSAAIGKCEKCSITVRLSKCVQEIAAKLVIESQQKTKILSAFSPIVQEICQREDVTEEALLKADNFDLLFSPNHVIASINRKS